MDFNSKMASHATGLAFRMRRRIATVAAVLVALMLGYHALCGQNGLTAYQQKRVESRVLAQQIQSLKNQNERLKENVQHLQSDPDAIEHEARERLHYARPGEVIYTLNDKPADPPKVSNR